MLSAEVFKLFLNIPDLLWNVRVLLATKGQKNATHSPQKVWFWPLNYFIMLLTSTGLSDIHFSVIQDGLSEPIGPESILNINNAFQKHGMPFQPVSVSYHRAN